MKIKELFCFRRNMSALPGENRIIPRVIFATTHLALKKLPQHTDFSVKIWFRVAVILLAKMESFGSSRFYCDIKAKVIFERNQDNTLVHWLCGKLALLSNTWWKLFPTEYMVSSPQIWKKKSLNSKWGPTPYYPYSFDLLVFFC